ncbi:hypothetical protein [Alysiella crassa]|uniref:Uncharacterized protein n=1 Tax=Alysiella crassa TaxID=153491 RepID=A0A376BU82_9NEIS|nr:hypothetical protein [Alysiella crassa]UOP05908.1 hypothetical protein LVJ80_08445 [Alysiella crassa]SSY80335.1 Uncharacterised protein [Alysiella crassa]
MNALPQIIPHHPIPTALRKCSLITNGNAHRTDLLAAPFAHPDSICEAMLPEIRAIATLIAAQRHDFNQPSPTHFTEEADWFAARILVLNVRIFHMEISQLPVLKLANQRAATFAKKHNIPFQAACIRASLHSSRPKHILLMECDLLGAAHEDLLTNTFAVKQQLGNFLCKLG